MQETKKHLAENKLIANQQALVDRLTPKPKATKKIIIPGGKRLSEYVDRENFVDTITTWLRGAHDFTAATISFSSDPSLRKTKKKKAHELTTINGVDTKFNSWQQPGGKRVLAEAIAMLLNSNKNVVAVEIMSDGIYLLTDPSFDSSSEDWEPYVEFQTKRPKYS